MAGPRTGATGPRGYAFPGNPKAEARNKEAVVKNAQVEHPPVAVPYAPTIQGKSAEQKAVKVKAVRQQKANLRKLRAFVINHPPTSQAVPMAKEGKAPPAYLKALAPETAKRAETAFVRHMRRNEALKEDPAAELVIDTGATLGVGDLAEAGGRALESGVGDLFESGGAKIASKEATVASSAAEKGIKVAAKTVKDASGKAIAKAKPIVAKQARGEAKRIAKAGRGAKAHPVRLSGGANAAALPLGVNTSLTKRAGAFVQGTGQAFIHHPGEVALTTGRGIEGMFAAPVELGASAYDSIKHGNLQPLEKTAGSLIYTPPSRGSEGRASGVVGMVQSLTSGNPKKVEEATRKEVGAVPEIPLPHIVRRVTKTDKYGNVLSDVRDKVEAKRSVTRETNKAIRADIKAQKGKVTRADRARHPIRQSVEDTKRGGNYVLRRTGKFAEKQSLRHRIAREITRMYGNGDSHGKGELKPLLKELKSSKSLTGTGRANPFDVAGFIAKHGIPHDEQIGRPAVAEILHNYPDAKPGDVPEGSFTDRNAAQYILQHPEIWKDKALWRHDAKLKASTAKIGTSPRNQYMAMTDNLINPRLTDEEKILKPEEMVPKAAEAFLPAKDRPYGRTEALNVALEREGQLRDLRNGATSAERKAGQLRADLRQRERVERIRQRKVGSRVQTIDELQRTDLPVSDKRALRPARKNRGPNKGKMRLETSRALEAKRAALVDADAHSRAARAEAARIERDQRGLLHHLHGLMKPEEFGGAHGGVDTTQATPYTDEMEGRYAHRVQHQIKKMGLAEPAAYIANVLPKDRKSALSGTAHSSGMPSVGHASSGERARSGNAEANFESTLYHSVYRPRVDRALRQGFSRLVDRLTRKVNGKDSMTVGEWNRAVNLHEVRDDIGAFRPAEFTRVLKGRHPDENIPPAPEDLLAAAKAAYTHGKDGETLLKAIEADKERPGEKIVPMSHSGMKELLGHLEYEAKGRHLGASITNFGSRSILNSPKFLQERLLHEVPMVASLGRDIWRLPGSIAHLKAMRRTDPALAAQIQSVAGSSGGLEGLPGISAQDAHAILDPIRGTAPARVWRQAWNLINGRTFSRFDRARSGMFREAVMSAHLEGEWKRWHKGAENLFHGMDEAVEAMKGMDRLEREAYTTAHPELGDRLTKDMNAMGGNWESYTVLEKHIAPAALFYSFIRYSTLFTLYSFPLNHPIVATALGLLGQAHAQALEKQEGGKLEPLDYTLPLIGRGKEAEILPIGKEGFPGLSALTEPLVTGKPSQFFGALSPELQIIADGIQGVDSYTGKPLPAEVKNKLLNGAIYIGRQNADLFPLLRLLGVQNIGRKAPSILSKTYASEEEGKADRTFLNAFAGEKAKLLGEREELSKNETKKGEEPIESPLENPAVAEAVYEAGHQVLTPAIKALIAKQHAGESASEQVKKKEEPFYPKGPQASEATVKARLKAIEEAWKSGPDAKKTSTSSPRDQFGLPSGSSSLREQFGLPATTDLRKQFGLE